MSDSTVSPKKLEVFHKINLNKIITDAKNNKIGYLNSLKTFPLKIIIFRLFYFKSPKENFASFCNKIFLIALCTDVYVII